MQIRGVRMTLPIAETVYRSALAATALIAVVASRITD